MMQRLPKQIAIYNYSNKHPLYAIFQNQNYIQDIDWSIFDIKIDWL
jgi:hypothetical protein